MKGWHMDCRIQKTIKYRKIETIFIQNFVNHINMDNFMNYLWAIALTLN